VRRASRAVALAFAASFSGGGALAQHCEPPAAPDPSLFRVTARADAAHYESGGERGYYEGFALGAAFRYAVLHARASLPYYRLLEPAGPANGFGDLESKLEIAVLDEPSWSLGGAFAASFPTGSAEKRLGMGHVMLGPSLWLARHAETVFASAELGFMGALDDGEEQAEPMPPGHHHHGASPNAHHEPGGPIPNPMNPNELWVGANVSYEPARVVRLNAGGTLAVPTSDDGETRATLRAGVEFPRGSLVTGVGVELDVLGITRRELALASAGFSF